jgi:ABC-type transport system involved in multi-copper enzyme maturation permease subunit
MHISGLSPFGPIFGKELRCASRRKRNYLLRVCYLGALLLFLLFAYAITTENYGPRGPSARVQQQEQLGQLFFMFFSMFCIGAMGLIGPVLTSTAINEERLHKTLHVLLMTPLTAWQIVSGKLFSRLLTALTLIGLSLPVLALVRLLGGVEIQQMVGVICLCAVVALSTAALGLLLSVMVSRAYAVILLSYLLMGIVYMFVPMIVMMYAAAVGARGAMRYFHFFATYNPFICTGFIASGQMKIFVDTWVPCVLLHLAITAVLLCLSALLVRRMARREGDANAAYTPAVPLPPPALEPGGDAAGGLALDPGAASAKPQAAEAPTPPIRASDIPRPRIRANRPVSDNPVLWRELRRPLMVTVTQRVVGTVIILALLVLVYGAAYANNVLDDEDTQIGFAIVFCALVMVVACVISATAIAQEKEGDTWTILLASPLSGAQIVWAKAIGTVRKMLWPIVLIVAHFAVFTVTGVIPVWGFVLVVSVIVLFNTIWIASGIYLSLRCRKVTLAIIINLALPVVLYGVFSLILAVIDEFGHMQGDLIEQVTWYLPFYYLGEGMDSADRGSVNLPGASHQSVSGEVFTTVAVVMGLLHLGVSLIVLVWTAARFNEIVGRAPQLIPLPPQNTRRHPNDLTASLGVSGR